MTQEIDVLDDLEYYITIDLESLFGHIDDLDERQREAEAYAESIRRQMAALDPDTIPIVPDDVRIRPLTDDIPEDAEIIPEGTGDVPVIDPNSADSGGDGT